MNVNKRIMLFFIFCFYSKWPQAENEGERDKIIAAAKV